MSNIGKWVVLINGVLWKSPIDNLYFFNSKSSLIKELLWAKGIAGMKIRTKRYSKGVYGFKLINEESSNFEVGIIVCMTERNIEGYNQKIKEQEALEEI